MSELLPLIEQLVRIDSVNPVLDPGRAGEQEIAAFVGEWAQARGLAVERLGPAGRPSLLVRARGSGGGRTLMLNAHLDTVGVEGMEAPFEPRLQDGRLHGRGVMDMKASLAVCMLVVERASRMGLRGDVVLAAVADEEHGSVGTEASLRATTADAAIVTEPTDLELHVAHRGFSVFEVEFEGKASHTSKPSEGVNAVKHLGRFLCDVEERDGRLRSGAGHPLLGHGSLQAVLAQGGNELFTTPVHATATVERRTVPGEDAGAAQEEIEGIVARMAGSDPSVKATVRTLVAREPFEATGEGAITRHLAAAIEEVRGAGPACLGAPYWTDAALVQAAGIPTVLFGPVGGNIHQPTEWLDVASTDEMLSVLERTVASFCG